MQVSDKASYIRGRILERNIESCMGITPEQMEIISILSMEHDNFVRFQQGLDKVKSLGFTEDELNKENVSPLLTIELESETAVPKVIYKGEEITRKRHVFFDWETDTTIPGGLTYAIEHIDAKQVRPGITRIERRVKGHATD